MNKDALFCQINEYEIANSTLQRALKGLYGDIDSNYRNSNVYKAIGALERKLYKLKKCLKTI